MVWTLIYFYFLLILRILSFFHFGTRDDLTIISGFSTLIPLSMIILNLVLNGEVKDQ